MKKSIIIILFIFSILSVLALAKPGFIYYDDGDTYAMDNSTTITDGQALSAHGWSTTGGTYDAGTGRTGRSLKTAAAVKWTPTLDFDSYPDIITMDFWFREATAQSSGNGIWWQKTGSLEYGAYWTAGAALVGRLRSATADANILANVDVLSGNAYHHFKIRWYPSNTSIELYLNDTLYYRNVTKSVDEAINEFWLADSTQTFYYDDIKLYVGTTDPDSGGTADTTPPRFDSISSNSTSLRPNGTDIIKMYVNVSDSINVSYLFAAWNNSGVWINFSNVSINNPSVNVSFNQSIRFQNNQSVGYRFMANDSSNNWNYSAVYTFTAKNLTDGTPPDTISPVCTALVISDNDNGTLQNFQSSFTDNIQLAWYIGYTNISGDTPVNNSLSGTSGTGIKNFTVPATPGESYFLGFNISDTSGNMVNCTGTGLSTYTPGPTYSDLEVCPTDENMFIVLLINVLIAIFFIILGYIIGNILIPMFGWILLGIGSFTILACVPLLGGVLFTICLVMILFSAVGIFKKR